MAEFEALPPEWWQPNTVNVTTFGHGTSVYTVSTCSLSGSPMPFFTAFVTTLGDNLTGNSDETGKDYETMLFVDGESVTIYPFGDLPGNEVQGVYQRYETREEAQVGHDVFVVRVQGILERENALTTRPPMSRKERKDNGRAAGSDS